MLAEEAVRAALSEGAEGAEAFEIRVRRISLNVERGVLKTSTAVREIGLGVRAHIGKKLGVAFATNPLEGASTGRKAFMNAKASPEDEDFHSLPEPRGAKPMDGLLDNKIRDIDVKEASSIFMASVEASKISQSIVSVSGIFTLAYMDVRVFSSTGVDVSESRTSYSTFLEVASREGDRRGSGFNFSEGRRLDMLDPERFGREAGEIAVKSLDSMRIGVETLPVVFKPKALLTIVPFIVDEAANAENIQYGRSFLTNRLNTQVASDEISIIDDGRIPWLIGSSSFDDEGIPNSITKVIEEGTFRNAIHNWYTAKKEDRESTGNASRDYRRIPWVSANNVRIEAPKLEMSEEELLDLKKGVLVLYTGDSPNLATGEFSGMAETAFLIEKGELTKSLRQTGIAFTLEELMKLEGIGRDVEPVGHYLGGSIRLRARVSGPGSS